ncbi:MAG: pyridoxamine 5'-phosphate oxidase [Azorhizobium sp. 39-67-5]|nr:MAG: pyridoxamine 5'-phosphate oxidase [Azorhizobium sp. 39-67-5]
MSPVLRLIQECRIATLATVEADGGPYASLVTLAPDAEGAPVLLLSDLARHTRNLRSSPRASLLVADAQSTDPLDAPRASLMGEIAPTDDPEARERFLARHPDASGFAGFSDFHLFRMRVDEVHLVEGFGRIATLPGSAAAIDWSDAEALRERAAGAIAHMNEDHLDAIALYAQKLLGAPEGDWRMLSLDPLGCNLMCGTTVRRLTFPQRITNSAALRQVLVQLAQEART